MDRKFKALKEEAECGHQLYSSNLIDQSEAKNMINPHLEAVNEKSVEIAKKYGMFVCEIGGIYYEKCD